MVSPRGKDFLKATAATLLVIGVTGPAIAAALVLSLAVMAGVSLVMLRMGIGRVSVSVEPGHARVFKGQAVSLVVKVSSTGLVRPNIVDASLLPVFGLTAQLGRLERGRAELSLTPRFAGRFGDLRVALTLSDVLGLYRQRLEFELETVLDSLPVSLLLPETPTQVSPIVQGEAATGGRGSGQELYSIEPYAPGSDAKDVMWKRLARSEDERMQVRAREASAKSSISILYRTKEMDREQMVRRTDLASEAVAQLGKRLVSMGVSVEVAHSHGSSISVGESSDINGLVSSIMRLWGEGDQRVELDTLLRTSDLVIIGQESLEDTEVRPLLEERPVLLLRETAAPLWSGTSVFSFSGEEDLSQLVEVLLER